MRETGERVFRRGEGVKGGGRGKRGRTTHSQGLWKHKK